VTKLKKLVPTNSVLLRERLKVKEACEPSLVLQTLKGKFLPCREIQFATEFAGEEFPYRLSPQNPVLWINFRGTDKTRVFGSNCGKGDRFLKR
jgi:hypothetical protein